MTLVMIAYFVFPPYMKQNSKIRDWIVKVDDEIIYYNDYVKRVEEEKNKILYLQQQFGAQADLILSSLGITNPSKIAFRALVSEKLLDNIANNMNINIESDLVYKEIVKIVPANVIDSSGNINMQALKALLPAGLSVHDFEKAIAQSLKKSITMSLLASTLYVPEFEIKNNYKKDYLAKKYSFIVFPFDYYLNKAKKDKFTINELKEFFVDQNKTNKRYWIPEKRSGIIWELNPENYGIQVSEEDVKNYYDRNKKKKFLDQPTKMQVRRLVLNTADKEKLDNIRLELEKNPEKFTEYVKKYSEDKISSIKGGLVEFKKGEQDPEFEKFAFRLKNDGDISNIIKTAKGYEILQRVSKKPEAYKPLDSVRSEIKNSLMNQRFVRQFELDSRRLKEKGSHDFEEFLKNKKCALKKLDNIQKDKDSNISTQKLFKVRANEIDYYVDNGKGFVVKLTDVTKSFEPDFETVQKTVESDLYTYKAIQDLKNDLEKYKKEAKSKSLNDIQLPGLKVEETDWLSRDNLDKVQTLKLKSIPVDHMLLLSNIGDSSSYIDKNSKNGYLFQLEDIAAFDFDEFSKKKDLVFTNLYKRQMQILENGFIASLYRNAKINRNQELLK